MPLDPSNPIVALCAAGMAAEGEGRSADAKALFEQAWRESASDVEACIAAHYVARHQATAAAELEWNAEALRRAGAAGADQVHGFHASLHLNFAHSLERVGRTQDACREYSLAAARVADVPPGPYRELVAAGVAAGRRRTCGREDGPC